SGWPYADGLDAPDAEAEIGWVIDLITAIRSVRAETTLPAGTQIPLVLVSPTAESRARAERWSDVIKRLARVSAIDPADSVPPSAIQLIVRGETVALPLAGLLDLGAERARLQKDMAK